MVEQAQSARQGPPVQNSTRYKDDVCAILFLNLMGFKMPESKDMCLKLIKSLPIETKSQRRQLQDSYKRAYSHASKLSKLVEQKRLECRLQEYWPQPAPVSMRDIQPGPSAINKRESAEQFSSLSEAIVGVMKSASRRENVE